MHEVITVDFAAHWRVPVFVRGAEGEIQTVRGPEDALRSLNGMGLHYEGTLHRVAKSKCMAALMKAATCDDAREAFVDVCFEMGALV